MASRPTTRSGRYYTQRTRDRLRANRIAERLVAFVLGENDPVTKRPVTMTASQVRAAQILLNKVLPDLKAVEVRDEAPQDAIARLLEAVMDHNQRLRKGGSDGGPLH